MSKGDAFILGWLIGTVATGAMTILVMFLAGQIG